MASLNSFVEQWADHYQDELKNVKLFQEPFVKALSLKQKQYFIKIFYHARGHFHDFLWFIGNNATDKITKQMILDNIAEEFNYSASSHEQMYFEFAKSFNVDIFEEITEEKNYIQSIKDFNHEHIRWLSKNSNNSRISALAAYEKLDNIDYRNLYDMAVNLETNNKGLVFFKVHKQVQHFEPWLGLLTDIWSINAEQVKNAFKFIGEHQLTMWNNISSELEKYVLVSA